MSEPSGISVSAAPFVSGYSANSIGRPKGCFGQRDGNMFTAYNPWAPKKYTEVPKEETKVVETQVSRSGSDRISVNLKLSNGAEISVHSYARMGVMINEDLKDRSNLMSLTGGLPNKYGTWHIDGTGGFVTRLELAFKEDCSDREYIEGSRRSDKDKDMGFLSSSITPLEQETINELNAIYSLLPEDNFARDDMKEIIDRANAVATSGWWGNFWRDFAGF